MNGLIYGIIAITIDDPIWVERTKNASLLVIHTIFMPLQSSEPLKRGESISLRKLAGEGQLDECNTCIICDIQT